MRILITAQLTACDGRTNVSVVDDNALLRRANGFRQDTFGTPYEVQQLVRPLRHAVKRMQGKELKKCITNLFTSYRIWKRVRHGEAL